MPSEQAITRLTQDTIDGLCIGVTDKKIFYRHDKYSLGLVVDRRHAKTRKSFIFEAKLHGRTLRCKIGNWPSWSVQQAERAARELRVKVDQGIDPRVERRAEHAAAAQAAQTAKARRATLRDAWQAYLAHRAASTKPLSVLTIRDYQTHLRRSFRDWADRKLTELTADAVAAKHKALVDQHGPAQGNQALRYLRAVLNFALKLPQFAASFSHGNPVHRITEDRAWADVQPNAATLRRDQLTAWWDATDLIENPVPRAYLRFLLLTGCRREAALSLQWDDVDVRWGTVTFRDTKPGGDRVIPLTRYVALLLYSLPRRNAWIFSSVQGASGRMREPAKYIQKVRVKTGIWMPSHGLRKSFVRLSEWPEISEGVIRQITGHVAGNDAHERHYRHRPFDLLAQQFQRYEDWLLAAAGREITADVEKGGLRLVG
jgi:integrase